MGHQLPSGALYMVYPWGKKIVPYFAHLSLQGLARWGLYPAEIRRYLEWYLAHLEDPDVYGLRGTVYDYEVRGEEEVPLHQYDSSDAYAPTFLSLVKLYVQVFGDGGWAKGIGEGLEMVAGAILGTLQKDGLTWARPDWKVKYLMDNCEVFRGLKDLAWIWCI